MNTTNTAGTSHARAATTPIPQMEEAVELILKLRTEPGATFHGRYFHVEDAILEPKPVQKPATAPATLDCVSPL